MLPRRLIALLVLACLVLPLGTLELFGQGKDDKDKKDKDAPKDKVTLAWKFQKDKPFYQTMTTDTDQKMTVMNNTVTQKQKQTFYFSWKPIEVKDGEAKLEQEILGVKMDIDIGGSKINYDSTATQGANNPPATTNPLNEFFKQLVGSKFTVTLNTKDLKVTKVEGQKEFLDKLVKANPQMKPLLEQILSEKALIEMAEPTFAVLPTDAKAPKDTWTRKTTLDMGPIGKYDNEYKYTFEGPSAGDKKIDTIKVETTLKYTPPGEAAGVGGLPFKIKSADLKSTNASGEIKFSQEKGRVEKSNQSLELKGELNIEIGGQVTKVELQQTQKTDVESSDDNPIKKK